MDGAYDRNAAIAWLRLDGCDPDRVRVEDRPWGPIERDFGSSRIVGLEYWEASERLPAELLDAPPSPPARELASERQRA